MIEKTSGAPAQAGVRWFFDVCFLKFLGTRLRGYDDFLF